MKHPMLSLVVALAALFDLGCSPTVTKHGVPNLVQVDARVWRSGQPTTPEAWAYLKTLGIEHVIKLNFPSEGTDDGARAAGLDVHELSVQPEGDRDVFDNVLNTFVRPDPAKLEEATRLLMSGGTWLVHCTHGQDRTGLVIGEYRVLSSRWTKDAAYNEMRKNNFHPALHGLHETWESFGAPR